MTSFNYIILCVIRRVCIVAKSACYPCHVCPSVRMHQHGSRWTDFREIWYWGLRKCLEKIRNLVEIGRKYWILYMKP